MNVDIVARLAAGLYNILKAELSLGRVKTGMVLSEWGVRGDGAADDGEAFQRALDSRPSLLLVPAGRYNIDRTLRVHGGTHLRLDADAIVRLATGAAKTSRDYLLTNANHDSGDADIGIEGGIWDGNSEGNPRAAGIFDDGYSGAMLHFQNVKGLRLGNMTLRNAEAFYSRFTQVRGFHIEGIRFASDRVRPNNDGIHLGGHCEDGMIRDIKGLHPGVTGDDLIALNADDALRRREVRGLACGPIRRVLIEDLEAEDCHSFVRLLSVYSAIEDITIRRVRGTCAVAAINCDAARGCLVPVFDEANPPFADGVGDLRNVEASDFFVAKSKANDIALIRLETRMSNVRITNFVRDMARDRDATRPTLRIRHTKVKRFVASRREGDLSLNFGERFEMDEASIDLLAFNPDGADACPIASSHGR